MALMGNLAIAFYFLCLTSTKTVLGIKPNFTSEPDKQIVVYQEETVNFTWKLSNHSFNALYFGTWLADHGTLGNTMMSLVRNGSEIPIYTIGNEKVKEYRGRVRWTGDLSAGVVSFELTNIKQTDQKYYGVDIEFNDDEMTEVTGYTQLVVKTRPVFTSAPSHMTQAAHGSAYFTWRYSLSVEDQASLSALVFGVYRKDTYRILCTIEIREKAIGSSNCSTGIRKTDARITSASPTIMATFALDNLTPGDEGVYSLRLGGTTERMENKTRLLIRGVKPHFTSEPDKQIVVYQEETVNFTWKLSNHTFNTLYFGTWLADHGTLGNTTISLVRNGSDISIYTSEKDNVKEYRGRVRWTGDLSAGVVSFELTNIKESDQKYYGVEIEFGEDMNTIEGFTKLVVKTRSVFTSAPSHMTQAARGSAYFTWRYSLNMEDQASLSAVVFGVYRKDTYRILCTIEIREKAIGSSNCSTGIRKIDARFTSASPTNMATFTLDNLTPGDEGVYSMRLGGTTERMENKTRLLIRGIKPHFTSEPDKQIVVYKEETANFTWKLSNHSINKLYFGTWKADHNTLGNTIMSLVRNGSEIPIYTIGNEKVKEYRGRVRWTGDLSAGVVSFELTNIKQSDHKYYGVEIEFADDKVTEVSGYSKLVVKTRSVFTSAPSHMTQAARGSAYFTWRYSLNVEDQASLSALVFGVYRKDTHRILCTIEIREKAIGSSNCSTGIRKTDARFTSASPTSIATFVLDNLTPGDEGVYLLRLGGTTERMENKTRLFIRGIKLHFTSEPDKQIVVYQEETVNFTWKLSNHSINKLYFGTWRADHGTLGNTMMSLVRNGSEIPIYTIGKEKVKEYRGRVRWTGDLSAGVVSFELTNIKQSDQKYYGVEILFGEDMNTIEGFTKLVVKTKSVVVKETNLCELNNGGCSHVCVFSSVTKIHSCKCPTGMDLSSDGKTCAMVHASTIPPSPYPPKSGAGIDKGPVVKVLLLILVASIIIVI